jgi:release factor glutamine methyltransferase
VTLLEILQRSTAWLKERGSDSPRLDAELLLAHGLGLQRLELYLKFDRQVTPEEAERLRALVKERGRGVPVAYLVGERGFHALSFEVSPDVLVPRPETEHLVEVALEALEGHASPVLADLGVGSGCVAVSVLFALPGARGHATDVSPGALAVAQRNAVRHGVADRLALHEGDLLAPLRDGPDWGRLDLVLSNPPYVVRGDPTLEARVAEHEPALALYVPGQDPLEVALRAAEQAREALAPGGLLALEVGAGSAAQGRARLEALGYLDVRTRADLAGVERILYGRTP